MLFSGSSKTGKETIQNHRKVGRTGWEAGWVWQVHMQSNWSGLFEFWSLIYIED